MKAVRFSALTEIVLVIAAAALVSRVYLTSDASQQLAGWEAEWLTSSAHFAALSLREVGYIPLWQPWLEFGEPLLNNPFSFILNPISTLPSLLLGGVTGIKLSLALSSMFAGLGGLVLGRALRVGALARLLLALLMIGKGNMLAMAGAGYFQLAAAQAYFPWVIGGAIITLRSPEQRWSVVLTALMFTWMFWAGNLWYTLPTLVTLALLTAAHVVRNPLTPQPSLPPKRGEGETTDQFFARIINASAIDWTALRRMLLAGVFTVGMSAITLLPLWIDRVYIGGHPDEIGAGQAVNLLAVVEQFVRPNLAAYGTKLPEGATTFYFSYVAPFWLVIPLCVALMVVIRRDALLRVRRRDTQKGIPTAYSTIQTHHRVRTRDDRWRVWIVGGVMVVVCTLWGAGGNPVFAWLYEHAPLLGQWRFVGRALAVASFWMAVLVTAGVDGVWNAIPGGRAWRAMPPQKRQGFLHRLERRIVQGLMALALTVIALAAAVDVNAHASQFARVDRLLTEDNQCLAWLRRTFPDRERAVYKTHYNSALAFLVNRTRLANITADFQPLPEPSTLGKLELTGDMPDFALAYEGYQREHLARVGYLPLEDSPRLYDQAPCLYKRIGETYAYAFTFPLSLVSADTESLPVMQTAPAPMYQRGYDRVRVWANAMPDGARVVAVQELAYPGWQARLDGQPAKLESVGGWIGVIVPPGEGQHQIEFAYRPPLLYLGGVVTLATCAVCIGYLLRFGRLLQRRHD